MFRRAAACFFVLFALLVLSGAAWAQDSDIIHLDRPAKDAVILVFNHGTVRPQVPHDCNRERDIPAILDDIAKSNDWTLYYLCSHATDGNVVGSYTYKRAIEILNTVHLFRALGVPARHIFLLGQSAGAWASLLAVRESPEAVNAVVAFAPAFAGPRSEEAIYPWWRQQVFPQQMGFVVQAKRLDALIFAFPEDAYDRPQELKPLTEIPGVALVTFDQCAGNHLTAYSECFRARARQQVETYIRSRLE